MREWVRLSVDTAHEIPEPSGRLLQFVARIDPDQPPLQALLVGEPSDRLLVYFPGFNTPLGPWEAAKCRMLATAFDEPVLLVERVDWLDNMPISLTRRYFPRGHRFSATI